MGKTDGQKAGDHKDSPYGQARTGEGDAGMHSHAQHGNENKTVVEVMEERHPMSQSEWKRLAELEGVIHRNLKAVFEVGAALAEIHRGRLYRATHQTFEAYIKSIYDFGVRHAYNIIDGWQAREDVRIALENEVESGITEQNATPWAALVAKASVNNCSHLPLPENEAQVRPLTLLSTAEERAEAWKEAYNIGISIDQKVTAKHVAKAVNQMRNIDKAVKLQKARKSIDKDGMKSAAFAEAAATFLAVVQHEVDTGFKETSKQTILAFCRSVVELVEAV